MKTIATLFAGGGGVECGAVATGLAPLWAVEYEPAIAEWHGRNFPDSEVICAPVQCVNPYTLKRPDVLHASPPCPNFSVAKAGAEETEEDLAMADAVCRFLRVLTPSVFTLENVMGYRQSQSYQRILCTLDSLGYWTHSDVVNAADYGVPQTRKRLILRAVRDGFPAPLPAKQKWVGWYESIEDLIPTLPESKFADWQLQRLPEDLLQSVLTDSCVNTCREATILNADEPSFTIRAEQMRRPITIPKAFLHGNGTRSMPVPDVEPADAITGNSNQTGVRAWLNQGRVVSMTPRALARFQSFPDSYLLPDNKTLACRIIGNAVPPKLYEAIVSGLVNQ